MIWRGSGREAPAPTPFENTYSFSFDGVDDRVQIGAANTSLGISGAITISFWCKMPVGSTTIGPVPICEDSGSGSNRNWNFICVYNSLIFQIWNADGTSKNCTSPSNSQIQDGNWHHVMATYTGDTSAGGIVLFIDGSSVATATASSTGLRTAAVSPFIGASGGGTPAGTVYNWEGEIDEVSVWDAVKTIADVSESDVPIDLDGKSNLVGWWRMGEGATFIDLPAPLPDSWSIPDDSSNSHDASSISMEEDSRVEDTP